MLQLVRENRDTNLYRSELEQGGGGHN